MIGRICVQGGDEFTEPCREMDEALHDRIGDGSVLVAPLACASGREYRLAGHNGRDYLRSLGFDDVAVAGEPDLQLGPLVRSIVEARIVVIPGGSPRRIRRRIVGTALGGALRAHIAGGGTIIGASAGAMVLAEWMLVPEAGNEIHPGLGLLDDLLVLPHFDEDRIDVPGTLRPRMADDVGVLGVPACAGALFDVGGAPVALGAANVWCYSIDGSRSALQRA